MGGKGWSVCLCVCVSVCLCVCVSLQGLQGSTLCAKIIHFFFLLCFFVFALSLFCFLLLLLLKKAAPGERGFRGRRAIVYRRSGGEGWGERERCGHACCLYLSMMLLVPGLSRQNHKVSESSVSSSEGDRKKHGF